MSLYLKDPSAMVFNDVFRRFFEVPMPFNPGVSLSDCHRRALVERYRMNSCVGLCLSSRQVANAQSLGMEFRNFETWDYLVLTKTGQRSLCNCLYSPFASTSMANLGSLNCGYSLQISGTELNSAPRVRVRVNLDSSN